MHQLWKELQKKGNQQQAYVHTVHVGIGGYDYVVVAQLLQTVFDVEGRLQKIEFLVLINHFFGQAIAVQGFALEAKNRLGLHVSRGCDGSRSRIAFGNKKRRL